GSSSSRKSRELQRIERQRIEPQRYKLTIARGQVCTNRVFQGSASRQPQFLESQSSPLVI
ncbi:MAG: hypothetical protein ACK557_02215, partial [Planctomycetota bacterium]